jgi:hypothetical protein
MWDGDLVVEKNCGRGCDECQVLYSIEEIGAFLVPELLGGVHVTYLVHCLLFER